MVRQLLRRLRRWLPGTTDAGDETGASDATDAGEEGVAGSGDPIPEPAYNSNWEADRSMRRIQQAAEEQEEHGHERR